MVVVPKPNGRIRLCIDLQKLNKYVRRPYHPSKSPAEAISNISSSSKFLISTLDATKGYWQVPLEKESQDFSTFITPFGRFKFLGAQMGLASSQDEYCARGDEALQGIEQVEKVIDDILIQGETAQEHLNTVVAVLNRCGEHGITLNPKKVQFLENVDRYVGYIVSSDGVKADPTKIEALNSLLQQTELNYDLLWAWQTSWEDLLTYSVKQQAHFGTCSNLKMLFFGHPSMKKHLQRQKKFFVAPIFWLHSTPICKRCCKQMHLG